MVIKFPPMRITRAMPLKARIGIMAVITTIHITMVHMVVLPIGMGITGMHGVRIIMV